VTECNKNLSDYQLCHVTERRENRCFENYSPIVIREMIQSSDNEDRNGIWNIGLFAFQTPDVASSPKIYCNILPLNFCVIRLAWEKKLTMCEEKHNTSKLWQQIQ